MTHRLLLVGGRRSARRNTVAEAAACIGNFGGRNGRSGARPPHYAATHGHVAMMRMLPEHHADIDTESPNGASPLMMAAGYGTAGAVKPLLEEGADPSLRNQQGLSAIGFAQRANRTESAELIAAYARAQQPKGKW